MPEMYHFENQLKLERWQSSNIKSTMPMDELKMGKMTGLQICNFTSASMPTDATFKMVLHILHLSRLPRSMPNADQCQSKSWH